MNNQELSPKQIQNFEQNGHISVTLSLNQCINAYLQTEDWNGLDSYFQTLICAQGNLFKTLKQIRDFSSIENIISIRDAANEWEEDGIWHDDGSRVLAFSLGLNLNPHLIEGGKLYHRKKNQSHMVTIDPISFGEIIIFKTGVDQYEHMVSAVTKGRRIIIAGWCS